MISFDELNQMPAPILEAELLTCCGSTNWAKKMLEARPFKDKATLVKKADEIWKSLSKTDWLEAFSHHPRIGDRNASARFTKDEQKGTSIAFTDTLNQLRELNEEYEKIFNHVYLVFATGKSAVEMLEILKIRIKNTPEIELQNAVAEQSKIMALRLEKLIK